MQEKQLIVVLLLHVGEAPCQIFLQTIFSLRFVFVCVFFFSNFLFTFSFSSSYASSRAFLFYLVKLFCFLYNSADNERDGKSLKRRNDGSCSFLWRASGSLSESELMLLLRRLQCTCVNVNAACVQWIMCTCTNCEIMHLILCAYLHLR